MRLKLIISMALLLVGSNLFTYTHTKYHTTEEVLTEAAERVLPVLSKEGLDTRLFPAGRVYGTEFGDALLMAGGPYFGWNELVGTRWIAMVLLAAALLPPLHDQRRRWDGSQMSSFAMASLGAVPVACDIWSIAYPYLRRL